MLPTGRELKASAAAGAVLGLYRSAEDMVGEAARRAPVEEGTLRGSGAVALIVNGSRFEGAGALGEATAAARAAAASGLPVRLEAEVSFNTVYAARQHEETSWQHPKGGRAKYLESVLAERHGRYTAVISASAARGA